MWYSHILIHASMIYIEKKESSMERENWSVEREWGEEEEGREGKAKREK